MIFPHSYKGWLANIAFQLLHKTPLGHVLQYISKIFFSHYFIKNYKLFYRVFEKDRYFNECFCQPLLFVYWYHLISPRFIVCVKTYHHAAFSLRDCITEQMRHKSVRIKGALRCSCFATYFMWKLHFFNAINLRNATALFIVIITDVHLKTISGGFWGYFKIFICILYVDFV